MTTNREGRGHRDQAMREATAERRLAPLSRLARVRPAHQPVVRHAAEPHPVVRPAWRERRWGHPGRHM